MAIIVKEQTSSSVATPSVGSGTLFIDSADDKLKRKDSTGTVVDIEAAASGVSSFEGRSGVVVSAAGDYTAAEVTNVPAGNISAITVQAAINELDSEKAPVTHVGSTGVSEHGLVTGSVAGFMSPSDKTKLDGVASGATANQTDAYLLARANHTGTQLLSTISDVTISSTNLNTLDDGVDTTLHFHASDRARANHTGTQLLATISDVTVTATQVNNIQSGVDYPGHFHDSDRARANHTGTQLSSTISDFNEAAQDAVGTILTDTATIDFTYDDTANTIAADVKDASITTAKIATGAVTDALVASGIAATKIGGGSVDNTEFGYLNGVTSAIQTQIDSKESVANVTSGLALKVAKAGDTMTGDLNVTGVFITDTDGTGAVALPQQAGTPATPSTGVKVFSDSSHRMSWKSNTGYVTCLDSSANTADRNYTFPNVNGTLMLDPLTTNGDIIYRNGSTTTRLPIGTTDQLLRVVGGVPAWSDENLGQDFGGGTDGDVTVSGVLNLTNATYYNTLTLIAGGAIVTNGYPLYAKTLDLSACDAACIRWNGSNGTNSTTQTGAAGGASLASAMLGQSGAGGTGATSTANAVGAQAAAPTNQSPSNGGAGGAGGAGGSGAAGAGGASRAGANATNFVIYDRFETQFMRGASLIVGGAGGAGGSSGAGSLVATGRGGAGGGAGGGVVTIYCQTLVTSGSTPSGAIVANGGNGGSCTGTPSVDAGGGAGGGGGGGGYIYLAYLEKTGAAVSNLIQANGGNGGNGGVGNGTGVGGNGGSGGNGGRVRVYNALTATSVNAVGTTGSAGTAGVGLVGGTGGAGGTASITL